MIFCILAGVQNEKLNWGQHETVGRNTDLLATCWLTLCHVSLDALMLRAHASVTFKALIDVLRFCKVEEAACSFRMDCHNANVP